MKALVAFDRVHLEAGEAKTIKFVLTNEELRLVGDALWSHG